MGFTLHAENYRALRRVDWSPTGVCALTGPNNSGKTTLLQCFDFLRTCLVHGPAEAATSWGGSDLLKHLQATASEEVVLRLSTDDLVWEMKPIPVGLGIEAPVIETIRRGGEEIASQARGTDRFDLPKRGTSLPSSRDSAVRRILDNWPEDLGERRTALERLREYRLYCDLQTRPLRESGSMLGPETALSPDGQNLFTVLHRWANSQPLRERWEFVRAAMADAFPRTIDDLDFPMIGQRVALQFYLSGLKKPIPASAVANGFLLMLLYLSAVASTPEGGLIGLDEPENGLHPHAIRVFLKAVRERAEERRLTVLLATHSPVVLDTFKEHPEQVFVMEPGHDTLPVRLDTLKSPEWLALYTAGDLYTHLKIGAQGAST